MLLTVFHKTQMREPAQVARAVAARKVCEGELRRLALGLNASLNIAPDADHEEVTFIAHPAA
ncbi:hypothetical protein [Streptomyces xanthochromogenes]|uniref:hypothetical protein n=1 Tax=Streptomyces xanthochromogenes TaxID=67384 RepID=UPI002F420CBC